MDFFVFAIVFLTTTEILVSKVLSGFKTLIGLSCR
jgi:hypothetical protein